MYVCICHAVTDTQIRDAVREDVTSLRELARRTGVATQCGRCALSARHCLKEALKETALSRPDAA